MNPHEFVARAGQVILHKAYRLIAGWTSEKAARKAVSGVCCLSVTR
jgi:hypothetical protein